MQIKIFSTINIETLENQVNEFLNTGDIVVKHTNLVYSHMLIIYTVMYYISVRPTIELNSR